MLDLRCAAVNHRRGNMTLQPGLSLSIPLRMFNSMDKRKSGAPWSVVLAAVLAVLLGMAAGGALYVWQGIGAVDISTDGLIALALGVGFSLALGIGLMRLVYYSSRRGFDDEVD